MMAKQEVLYRIRVVSLFPLRIAWQGRLPLPDYQSPSKASLHILRFHQILRLTGVFHISPFLSLRPNTLLLKDNSRSPVLSVLGRLFAVIFPILILSPNSEATVMEDIMNVIKIMVIVVPPKNAQEASA
jgi:hypothetical protein